MRNDLHVHYSASLYDHYSRHGVEGFDLLTTARVLNEVRQRAPGALLDVGTGTGVLPIKLAQRVECAQWRIVGTDFFEDMIAICESNRAEAPGGSQLDFLHDDVHAMRFSDASFDIVLARSNVHHWRDPVLAFREIFRVLSPGGVAIVHEPRRDSNPEALASFNESRATLGVEPSRVEEKFSTKELKGFLENAGIAEHSTVSAPERGIASLGVEILIRKPGRALDA